MLTTVRAGPYTVRGVSVGGIYTALEVAELKVMFDVGLAPRSFASVDDIFVSHGHADHIGALTTLLGVRGLVGKGAPRLYVPAEIVDHLQTALAAMSKLQRYELSAEIIGMRPGDEVELRGNLRARAFRTFHPVPSLGYQLLRRVTKLKPEHLGMPGPEIALARDRGDDIFFTEERIEVAYATDTLLRVIESSPEITRAKVLIMECSFLDERKDIAASRAGCHIHLDELLEHADAFENEHLVLMHFSQIYRPREVHEILQRRCPEGLLQRIIPFTPKRKHWPG